MEAIMQNQKKKNHTKFTPLVSRTPAEIHI